jgi:hypothetical protein
MAVKTRRCDGKAWFVRALASRTGTVTDNRGRERP